jgi:phosphoribosyl 1,2-cyclic phosphate phosphodiesterase
MKIKILGCGGSFGSPLAWQRNGNIDVNNKRNFRSRSSILVSDGNTTLLIDTSPDLRQQLYDAKCTNIDAVLFSHIHSDHTSGLPDMRSISLINNKIIPAYMNLDMKDELTRNYKYIFSGDKDYAPFMLCKNISENFSIDNFNILSFKHNHGSIDVQTFRIGNFAYTTDIKKFYNDDIDKLKNLDLWIVGLLRPEAHPSHAGFKEIIEYIKYLKPEKTIFTHMTALIDEETVNKLSPENVYVGFDGMEIDL